MHSSPPQSSSAAAASSSSFFSPLPKPGNREASETTGSTDEGKKENSQIGWVLQGPIV